MERSEGTMSTYVDTDDCGRENIDSIIILSFNGYWNFFIFFCSSEDFIPMVAVCSIFGLIWFDCL